MLLLLIGFFFFTILCMLNHKQKIYFCNAERYLKSSSYTSLCKIYVKQFCVVHLDKICNEKQNCIKKAGQYATLKSSLEI